MTVVQRIIASRPLAAIRAALRSATASSLHWIIENAPVFGRMATQRRQRVVLAPYKKMHTIRGPLLAAIAVPILIVFCFAYGLLFGLSAPYIMVPFVIPIVAILSIIIWALPENRNPPTFALEYLLPLFFIVMILWPNYVALLLSGLPWITLQRLVYYPMGLIFMINLSVSRKFRTLIFESVTSIKLTWFCLCALIVVAFLTIALSPTPLASGQIVLNQSILWLIIFAISSAIFRRTFLIEKYFYLLCLLGIAIVALVLFENHRKYIPWAAHIPNILRIHVPSVENTLKPDFRPYTTIYRAKATFSGPLPLAEFLSLLTPLFLYFGFSSKNVILKFGALFMVPMLFIAIRMTDARLGVVGMLISVLLYGSVWSVVRWRSRPNDLFAAAIVYGYPAIFVGGIGMVLASHTLSTMVFGGGAQVGSTNARKDQLGMAMTSLAKAPWGHGAGQSGAAMGFSEGQPITVDNYFITIVLDYGVLGALCWYAAFLTAIFYALRYCVSPTYGKTREAQLLAPLAVMMIAFLVIKWVHGQDENHPIYFMVLGMISALVFSLRHNSSLADGAAPVTPKGGRRRDAGPVTPEFVHPAG